MNKMDAIGDRMKEYERQEIDRRFMSSLPIYARIDGRNFSNFTRKMVRPYDIRMTNSMIQATKTIVESTHATIAYTQSDEISIVWNNVLGNANWFDGKIMKMSSVLAGLASSAFIRAIFKNWPQDEAFKLLERCPHFDARVIAMPSLTEVANMLLWRNLDATKNALSMAASHYYSHSELMNKNSSDKNEMLFQKGINFNEYPASFKRGTWISRKTVDVIFTEEHLADIPEKYRPALGTPVKRTIVSDFDLPPLNKISNRIDVLFNGADPINITE